MEGGERDKECPDAIKGGNVDCRFMKFNKVEKKEPDIGEREARLHVIMLVPFE
jgi:hypothetical protein